MRLKCKDCIYCNKKKLVCRPEAKDCRKEYPLNSEDLETEAECDFGVKRVS